MRIQSVLTAAFLLLAPGTHVLADAPDPWQSLAFLEGAWKAETTGGSAAAKSSGTYSFVRDLRGHVFSRRSTPASCNGPKEFDCEHSDMLFVYEEGPAHTLKAIYFDNEGHVIHYDVTTPEANAVVFLSPDSAPGPQFRLSYKFSSGIMSGKFEMHMPGANAWNTYLAWQGPKARG